jgi:N-acetylneuraminic acid mutarotase
LEGGPQPYDLLPNVDVYDPANDVWAEVAPMRQGRQLFAAAFGPEGRLYAFGGYGHKGSVRPRKGESDPSFRARLAELERLSQQVLDSVEAYDPAADTWEGRSPMPVGVEGMGAALGADGRIYVVGGTRSYSSPVGRREVQVYDPRTDSWSRGPPLRTERQALTVVSTSGGRIYAIGGTNERLVMRPLMIVGGSPGTKGAPLASVEVLETDRQ